MRTIHLLTFMSALLTFFASLCELITAGLTHAALRYARSQTLDDNGGWIPINGDQTLPPPVLEVDPEHFVTGFASGELAAATVSLLLALLAIVWTVYQSKHGSCEPRQTLLALLSIFAAATSMLDLGILAWVFVVTGSQGAMYLNNQPAQSLAAGTSWPLQISLTNTITWETYVCDIAPVVRGIEGGGWFSATCNYNVSAPP